MSSRFSVPRLVLPRRPTAGTTFSQAAWARALPLHAALAALGVIGAAAALAGASPALAVAAASSWAIAERLRRSLRAIGPDTPLVAALVRGERAHVLDLRAAATGWRPSVLDARLLSRRNVCRERAVGWLVRHRGGYAFLPLASLLDVGSAAADPGRMPEGYFALLERLSRSPRLELLSDGELAEAFGMRLRAPPQRPELPLAA